MLYLIKMNSVLNTLMIMIEDEDFRKMCSFTVKKIFYLYDEVAIGLGRPFPIFLYNFPLSYVKLSSIYVLLVYVLLCFFPHLFLIPFGTLTILLSTCSIESSRSIEEMYVVRMWVKIYEEKYAHIRNKLRIFFLKSMACLLKTT